MKTDCKRNILMKMLEHFFISEHLKKKLEKKQEAKKNQRTSGVYSRQYLHHNANCGPVITLCFGFIDP
jgi:hypothetical protein